MNTANQELWIAGSGSTPGKLVAKSGYPNFSATSACLIRVQAAGCKINGYANGTSASNGRATLEMFRSSYTTANGYTLGEHRMTIRSNQNNTTIQGIIAKNSGGDGIYIDGGTGGVVKDVIVDGANRNGISVIKADNLAISNSTFKNTTHSATTGTGNGPGAGIDFEPNLVSDSLTNIVLTNCIFSYNSGDNIMLGLGNLGGAGVGATLDIRFYGCTSDHSAKSGILLAGMREDGPTLGMVYFQDTSISYAASAGIKVRQWVADQTRITFNDFTMTHCADSSSIAPIYLEDSSGVADRIGEVQFQGECYVDDYNSAHANILRGTSWNATVFKDITGAILYRRNYTASTPVMYYAGGTQSNVTLTATPY
jgi:hypothetical protein